MYTQQYHVQWQEDIQRLKRYYLLTFFKGIIGNSAIDILFDLVVGIGAIPAGLPLI